MKSVDTILSDLKKIFNVRTDADIAKRLGVKPGTISSWRKRESLQIERIAALCEEENIPIGPLLTDEQIPVQRHGQALPPKVQTMVDAVVEIMTSDHDGVKQALSQNVAMFQETVRSAKRIAQLERDMEAIKKVLNPNAPSTGAKEE